MSIFPLLQQVNWTRGIVDRALQTSQPPRSLPALDEISLKVQQAVEKFGRNTEPFTEGLRPRFSQYDGLTVFQVESILAALANEIADIDPSLDDYWSEAKEKLAELEASFKWLGRFAVVQGERLNLLWQELRGESSEDTQTNPGRNPSACVRPRRGVSLVSREAVQKKAMKSITSSGKISGKGNSPQCCGISVRSYVPKQLKPVDVPHTEPGSDHTKAETTDTGTSVSIRSYGRKRHVQSELELVPRQKKPYNLWPNNPPDQSQPPHPTPVPRRQVNVWAICGPSGAGKSTLARHLESSLLSPISPISTDLFVRNPSEVPPCPHLAPEGCKQWCREHCWERPCAYNLAMLHSELKGLIEELGACESKPKKLDIMTPSGPEPLRWKGFTTATSCDIIIEGFVLFAEPKLVHLATHRIMLGLEWEEAADRRYRRNRKCRKGSRRLPLDSESFRAHHQHHVHIAHMETKALMDANLEGREVLRLDAALEAPQMMTGVLTWAGRSAGHQQVCRKRTRPRTSGCPEIAGASTPCVMSCRRHGKCNKREDCQACRDWAAAMDKYGAQRERMNADVNLPQMASLSAGGNE